MVSSPMTDFLIFAIFILFCVGYIIFKIISGFCLLQGYRNLGNRKAIKWFTRAIKFADIGCGVSNDQIGRFGKIISHLSIEEDDIAMREFLFSNCAGLFMTMIVAINRFELNVKNVESIIRIAFPIILENFLMIK